MGVIKGDTRSLDYGSFGLGPHPLIVVYRGTPFFITIILGGRGTPI